MIYLDNSATTYPKPPCVFQAVSMAMKKYGANPGRGGYDMANETALSVYDIREKLAIFFGAKEAENVVFTKSCTEALNLVIFGKLKAGDHVVISDLEHNAVLRPVIQMEKRGVSYSIFKTGINDDETLNNLRESFNANTKLVVCTAASNVFGIRLPIKRICALCSLNGIEICIDGAQGAGLIPIDIESDGIDYLCIPSHKGLYGLMGCGALIGKNINYLTPIFYGGTGINSKSGELPDLIPERFESGTQNLIGIISMGAGVDFIKEKGMEKIINYEMTEVGRLYWALKNMKNVELYTDFPKKEKFVPVLSFNILSQSSEAVGEKLNKFGIAVRCGMHCAPLAHKKFLSENGTVRVSPSVFTSRKDVDFAINKINYLQNNNF